jgi:hypothetical protein
MSLIPGLLMKKKKRIPVLSGALSDGIKDVFHEMGYKKFESKNPINIKAFQEGNSEHIDEIAALLADNFVKKIYDLQNEKSYSAYVKSLSEVFHWAHEFYIEYNHKIKNWESFSKSGDNIYKATTREAFQIAWGNERIQLFADQHSKKTHQKIRYLKSSINNNIIEPELSGISI